MQEMRLERVTIRRGMLLAIPIFVIHFLEESPGFVAWVNARLSEGITQDLFWTVNLTGLLITLVVVFVAWNAASTGSMLLLAAWLSFLMLANGLFHITAAIVDRAYVPGLVSAALLYLPYSIWMGRELLRTARVSPAALATVVILGAIPMAVHGYRIIFLGTRLF